MFINRSSRRLVLTPITEKDYALLAEWRNDDAFLAFCMTRRTHLSPDRFLAELKSDFEKDRHEQFVIRRAKDAVPVGTAFSSGLNITDGIVFETVYIAPAFRRFGYGPEAFILFAEYLFNLLPIRKICTDVSAYNKPSLSTVHSFGLAEGILEQEGCFKKHRYYNGEYHDVIRFALYPGIVKLPLSRRLLSRKEE